MSEQEETKKLVETILANANVARKTRLIANRRISAVIDKNQFVTKERGKVYVLHDGDHGFIAPLCPLFCDI